MEEEELNSPQQRGGKGCCIMDQLGGYHYVYVLRSLRVPGAHYTGSTEDLQKRLYAHNSGAVSHTSKYKPWRIQTAIAFTNRSKALAFERYLKTGSGRAFATKHFY